MSDFLFSIFDMEDFTAFLNITYNNVRPQRGKVLISQPLLSDGCFGRSVVLITEYSKDGTIGLILNKWMEVALEDLLEDFPGKGLQLSLGGPLRANTLLYLHTFDNVPGSIKIFNGIYWGGDLNEVCRLLSLSVMKPENIRFFLGYSGWTAGQLEDELKSNSWLVGDLQPRQIICPTYNLWKESVRSMGDEYMQWTNMPENPAFN